MQELTIKKGLIFEVGNTVYVITDEENSHHDLLLCDSLKSKKLAKQNTLQLIEDLSFGENFENLIKTNKSPNTNRLIKLLKDGLKNDK